jgi:hypothetical protein
MQNAQNQSNKMLFEMLLRSTFVVHLQNKTTNKMKAITTTEYARVVKLSEKTFAVIDSANQCLFAHSSERKVKNRLANILKCANVKTN